MKKIFLAFLAALLLLSSCNASTPDNEVPSASNQATEEPAVNPSSPSGTEKVTDAEKPHLHSVVTDAAVAATCKSTGLTEGSHCKTCGKTLSAQAAIPKTYNHKFVQSQNGLYACSVCNLKVAEHGNADGSLSGGNSKVKYYVTGDIENGTYYEIVIWGSGAIPDFRFTDLPMWYDYLPYATKITVASGITAIGSHAFFHPEAQKNCQFEMADTVRIIKSNAINLKINNLVLGSGVVSVEADAFLNVTAIYIPKSVEKWYPDVLGNETIFYEGTLEEFYQIKVNSYGKITTMKNHLESLDDTWISNIHIYVNAKSINDTNHYWR